MTGPSEGEGRRSSGLTPAMKIVIIIAAVVVAAGAIIVPILLNAASPTDAAPGDAPSGEPAGVGAPESSPTAPGPLPQATPTTGSEVLPPSAQPNDHLPEVTPMPALMSPPLPESASAVGGLADGFPDDILGPIDDSQVQSSSIATEKTTTQITLVATTSESPDDIRAHYDALWTGLGLHKRGGDDASVSYVGAHESIALAVEASGTGNRYTIYGVFRTK